MLIAFCNRTIQLNINLYEPGSKQQLTKGVSGLTTAVSGLTNGDSFRKTKDFARLFRRDFFINVHMPSTLPDLWQAIYKSLFYSISTSKKLMAASSRH